MITKNIITFAAALSIMFSSAPITLAHATETTSATILTETTNNKVDISHFVGNWKYQISDTDYDVSISSKENGIFAINNDGTYTYTDIDSKSSTGMVKLGTETIGGTTLQTVNFYEGSELRFGAYYNDNEPDALYFGNNRISRIVRIKKNEVSLSDFVGKWNHQEADSGYPVQISARNIGEFEISADGTFIYTDKNGKTETGTVKLGDKTIGRTTFTVLRFFENTTIKYVGTCLEGRPDELYLGNSGRIRLSREEDKKSYNTYAIENMSTYTFFDTLFASELPCSDNIGFSENGINYYKVNDLSLFKSIDELKDVIEKEFTGEVKDYFMKECDARFIEKDGCIYESKGSRGSFEFTTTEGVAISDVTADKFTATTMASNGIHGQQKAVFVLENGSWKMSSFTYGKFKTESTEILKPTYSLIGDTNCDGQVDMSDAVLIMQALANPNKFGENGSAEIHLTAQGKINGDIDGNGLTVGDAHVIQEKLLTP